MPDLKEAVGKLKPEDLKIDHLGRVVITNAELEREIKDAVTLEPSLEELAGNGICCGNGNCASPELVSLFERVVGGRVSR